MTRAVTGGTTQWGGGANGEGPDVTFSNLMIKRLYLKMFSESVWKWNLVMELTYYQDYQI